MTNILDKAADTLDSGHWCVGHIKDGDKFCAVGAIGYHMGLYDIDTDESDILSVDVYSAVRATKEGKALAEAILETDWYRREFAEDDSSDYIKNYMNFGAYEDVIIEFNDSQDDPQPVIELFRVAARKLD